MAVTRSFAARTGARSATTSGLGRRARLLAHMTDRSATHQDDLGRTFDVVMPYTSLRHHLGAAATSVDRANTEARQRLGAGRRCPPRRRFPGPRRRWVQLYASLVIRAIGCVRLRAFLARVPRQGQFRVPGLQNVAARPARSLSRAYRTCRRIAYAPLGATSAAQVCTQGVLRAVHIRARKSSMRGSVVGARSLSGRASVERCRWAGAIQGGLGDGHEANLSVRPRLAA